MIDPTIAVALISLIGIGLGGLFKRQYDRDEAKRKRNQEQADQRLQQEEDKRKEEGRIIDLMVKDFQSTREEVGGFNSRNKEMWNDIMTLQRANFACENRCAVLAREVDDLKRDFTDWKALNARWQAFTGQEAPP